MKTIGKEHTRTHTKVMREQFGNNCTGIVRQRLGLDSSVVPHRATRGRRGGRRARCAGRSARRSTRSVSKRRGYVQLQIFSGLLPRSQGQNLALTVSGVPYSLDCGLRRWRGRSTRCVVPRRATQGRRAERRVRCAGRSARPRMRDAAHLASHQPRL